MIVCHCNVIHKSEIEEVITSLLDEDCWRLIVPLQVFHAMEKRGRCCGCFPGVIDIIIETTEAYHKQHATPEAEIISLIDRLRADQKAREIAVAEAARAKVQARLAKIRAA